jgi:hypothetical protein
MSRLLRLLPVLVPALVALAGCAGGKLGTLKTQNRILLEQTKAQLAEIENLKIHARQLEDRLLVAESRLAQQEEHSEDRPDSPARR